MFISLLISGEPSIRKLLKTLDEYVPTPVRDLESPYLMPIDNVFNIHGRGCIVVGTIKRGIVKRNSAASLMGFGTKLKTSISDLQIFRKSVEQVR
jgi:elongation factor Tu